MLIGTAKLVQGDHHTRDVGSDAFMAPEVKDGEYTTAADIYSFGCILVEMIV